MRVTPVVISAFKVKKIYVQTGQIGLAEEDHG